MNKITWIKPSGIEVVSNDLPATIAAAQSLGWKQKEELKKEESKKDK